MNLSYNDDDKIFDLKVDEVSKSHLLETARWGKFLGILGIIFLALALIGGIFMGAAFNSLSSSTGSSAVLGAFGTAGTILYIVLIVAIEFYPIYALLKFSNQIRPALLTSNQEQFNSALGYLKSMFKYIGIIAIIILSLYALGLIFAIIGAAISGV